ncbi:DUF2249 domain-containing protein [Thiocystis violacea]|uniref:DUF2249 domain-containing protein n=1 Tax=Thiocystis violacea TaxID=13725 RepID=UPI001904A24B|nr:DUF2249 domain-containing protein [Thiocystis violacea]MBK1720675.1 hypothetical protein [Thiocystis violacea]
MERCVLDVRWLEPPEPMERILDTLADMPPGERLWVLHRREPFPLYDLLRRMGYGWQARGGEERFEILIWSAEYPPHPDELVWGIPC